MKPPRQRAFALILVLSLLSLLVLLVYALAALNKVDAQLAGMAVYQTQARQNALLGLNHALGQLQQLAGADDRLTGMAGITGVPAGGGNAARHWCGVWSSGGVFLGWLASGANGPGIPALTGADAVEIVSTATLNTDATDREHVRVLCLPLAVTGSDGLNVTQGRMAFWVGDEGVKLSLVLSDAQAVVAGGKHAITQQFPDIQPTDARLANLLAYEQVALLGATAVQRQGGFHSHGRTHYGLIGGELRSGRFNVNSSSARYWTGVGATYNLLRAADAPALDAAVFGTRMANASLWANAEAGKSANGPFQGIDAFLASTRVGNAITGSGGSSPAFREIMQPWLAIRSDTFRIRAYGDALNPVPEPGQPLGRIEAVAWCEAIVQRTPEPMPRFGRRFIITSFRWLGPDDI